jgi:hypothetical protein
MQHGVICLFQSHPRHAFSAARLEYRSPLSEMQRQRRFALGKPPLPQESVRPVRLRVRDDLLRRLLP